MDQYSEVREQSWFERVGSSIFAAIVGFILFVAAFPLEIWNEGRAVAEFKAFEQGAKSVVSVSSDSINPANDGKLVHFSGNAVTTETLTDETFGVSAKVLKLKRAVEMYQWEETKSSHTRQKLGGGSETVYDYSYHKRWSSNPIRSATFHASVSHQNPSMMPFEDRETVATDVKVGAFTLNRDALSKLSHYERLPVSQIAGEINHLPAKVVSNNDIYIGSNSAMPAIGDARVSFSVVPQGQVSIVAKQTGNTIEAFSASNGQSFELVQSGVVPASAMFKQAEKESNVFTWVLRLVGVIAMFAGLRLMGKPLSTLADIIPFLGGVLSAGLGIMSFFAALFLSAMTIGVSWIAFRPILGFSIIGGGVVIGILSLVVGRGRGTRAAT